MDSKLLLTIAGLIFMVVWFFMLRKREKANGLENAKGSTSENVMLGVDDLRRQVESAIAAGKLVAGKGEFRRQYELGGITQDFFSRYPFLQTPNGSCKLGGELIRPSSYAKGLISIGNWEDWDICQIPGKDKVYVLEGSELSVNDTDDVYPTVYHFLLDELRLEK